MYPRETHNLLFILMIQSIRGDVCAATWFPSKGANRWSRVSDRNQFVISCALACLFPVGCYWILALLLWWKAGKNPLATSEMEIGSRRLVCAFCLLMRKKTRHASAAQKRPNLTMTFYVFYFLWATCRRPVCPGLQRRQSRILWRSPATAGPNHRDQMSPERHGRRQQRRGQHSKSGHRHQESQHSSSRSHGDCRQQVRQRYEVRLLLHCSRL